MYPTQNYISVRKDMAAKCLRALKAVASLAAELEDDDNYVCWESLVVGAIGCACRTAYPRFIVSGEVRVELRCNDDGRWEYLARISGDIEGGEDWEMTFLISPAFLSGYDVYQL